MRILKRGEGEEWNKKEEGGVKGGGGSCKSMPLKPSQHGILARTHKHGKCEKD